MSKHAKYLQATNVLQPTDKVLPQIKHMHKCSLVLGYPLISLLAIDIYN